MNRGVAITVVIASILFAAARGAGPCPPELGVRGANGNAFYRPPALRQSGLERQKALAELYTPPAHYSDYFEITPPAVAAIGSAAVVPQ